MSIPLMILGPGGDYQTRYEPAGRQLLRRIGRAQEHPSDGDTETAGSRAGYDRGGGRRGGAERSAAGRPEADRLEVSGAAGEPGAAESARRWVKSGSLLAAAAAIEAWLAQQQKALRRASIDLGRLAAAAGAPGEAHPAGRPAPATGTAEVRTAATYSAAAGADFADHAVWRRIHNDARAVFADGPNPPESRHAQTHAQATRRAAAHPRLAIDARLFPDPPGAGRRTGRQQGHRVRARRGADPQGGAASRAQQGTLFGAVA